MELKKIFDYHISKKELIQEKDLIRLGWKKIDFAHHNNNVYENDNYWAFFFFFYR